MKYSLAPTSNHAVWTWTDPVLTSGPRVVEALPA